jgi:caffeoyl-CoA O-methyltransferase
MKSDETGAILQPAQERYLDRLLPPREPLLAEMEKTAREDDVPISDPEVGKMLGILAGAVGARRILEIGTAIGYGVLWMARAVPEARIVSIDSDPERLAQARGYLERAGVLDRVELIEGEALTVLPRLQGPFDLVYVDAVKEEYRRYLDLALPLVKVDGLLVFDNLLWMGHVAEPPATEEDEDPRAQAMYAFNPYLMIHPQLQSLVLPLGDGLGIARKVKPTIREMGGPY